MKEKISDFIIPIGILLLGYTVMQKLFPGSTQGTGQLSTTATKECPRSPKYSITPLQMITGGCDAGYTKETDWFGLYTGNCVCNSPSVTPPVNSPPGQPPASNPPTPSTPSWWDKLFPSAAAPAETVPSTPMPLTDPAVWSIYHPSPFVQPPGSFQPIAGQGLTGIAGLDYLQNRISGDFASTPTPTVGGGGGGGGDGTYTSSTGQSLSRTQAQAAGIID